MAGRLLNLLCLLDDQSRVRLSVYGSRRCMSVDVMPTIGNGRPHFLLSGVNDMRGRH